MNKGFTRQNFSEKNLGGLTLIEVLVVTSIIFILTSVVLLNYGTRESQLALQRSQNKLAQDIRQARDLAMNTKEFGGLIPSGGYGVYFDLSTSDSSYTIYADLNGDEKHDASDGISDGIVETCQLEKNIFIKSTSPAPLSINFLAPDPSVKISESAISATIILAIKSDPNNTKTITINKLGLITIE